MKRAAQRGQAPRATHRELLEQAPEYQRARDEGASPETLFALVAVFRDERPKQKRPRASVVSVKAVRMSPAERRQAAAVMRHHAQLAALDPEVVALRRGYPSARIKWAEAGRGDFGEWQAFTVDATPADAPPGPGPWVGPFLHFYQLCREPVALEIWNEAPYALLEPAAASALRTARRLGLTYGWSEAAAVRFIFVNETPRTAPFYLRTLKTCATDGTPVRKEITLTVERHASRRSVVSALTKMMGKAAGRPQEPPAKAMKEFMPQDLRAHQRSRWSERMARFNAVHPNLKFRNPDAMCKAYLRATRRAAQPRPKQRRRKA